MALFASFNVPLQDPGHAANAVRAAMEIQQELKNHTFGPELRLNTRYGTHILASATTRELAGDDLPFEPIGDVTVRRRSKSVQVFSVPTA